MRLKVVRQSTGLTQEDVAKALNVSRTAVAMWESGSVNPTADKLPAIAALYGCSIDELYEPQEQEAI